MDEIVLEFQSESRDLIGQLTSLLEEIEGNYSQVKNLETYGQLVDRIMGTAKNLVDFCEAGKMLQQIADYGEICKLVSYKCAKISDNEALYNVVIAFLQDATEVLSEMVEELQNKELLDVKQKLSDTFLDRLRWLAKQFDQITIKTTGVAPTAADTLAQGDIDALLKKLGV